MATSHANTYRIGCDIGGTFTDFVLYDARDGSLQLRKCLTTPSDPSEAVIQGVSELQEAVPDCLSKTAQVLHGTTLVINAVLERKGEKTALLTTQGFRDVLEIGTERRYDLYDLQQTYPEPLVPRDLRIGIRERTGADGQILLEIDEAQIAEVAETLSQEDVRSVAVCLLHSFTEPANEQRLGQLLQKILPDLSVSLSCEVLPEINEFTRTSTTVVNAYCKPLMTRYLTSLDHRLQAKGLAGVLNVILSSGGVASVDTGSNFPARMIESGPVGGVILAQHIKQLCDLKDAFAFDMGGTTAKICIIEGDTLPRTSLYEVARTARFKPGSGIPVKVPCVDLLEIGTGGGSIAGINALDLLQVGPHSAGSEPGPACYGQGGENPTVTDADLVLGYLDPEFFLGGDMRLDVDAAKSAIDAKVARPLGLGIPDAAFGIHDAANESMAAATRMYAAERGLEASELALVASGGAGPVHCYGLAAKLGVREIIIPTAVGVASALGFLVAPVSYDLVRTFKTALADLDTNRLETAFAELESEARSIMSKAGEEAEPFFRRSVDIRYVGQGYEINVDLAETQYDVGELQSLFGSTYAEQFGRAFDGNAFELVNLRLIATGPTPTSPFRAVQPTGDPFLKGTREAWCPQQGRYVAHQVYDRYAVPPGKSLAGPAIFEERESTVVVGTGAQVYVDENGLLRIHLPETARLNVDGEAA